MVEAYRHPNIDLFTYSEVIKTKKLKKLEGFEVKIRKKPRYVDIDKCTGCGICEEKCAVKNIPSEFEAGLGNRGAAYIPFPQAVPRKATLDAPKCLYLKDPEKDKCKICEKECPSDAIDYEQKEEIINVNVASIIVATGFDQLEPSIEPLYRYNYDRFGNVINSMEFERMLSASGPTGGAIVRLSDPTYKKRAKLKDKNVHPKRVAFILCVGSRNLDVCEYCSKFCCMYSAKAAIIAKEHAPELDIYIYYNDLRAIGKNQEEFFVRAREEYDIHFVRGIPGNIEEIPKSKNLIVRHADLITGEVLTEEFDLVVLSSAVVPRKDADQLAEILGIETDKFGFFETNKSTEENESSVNGIFLAGCCQSPDDIPNSIAKASAAASKASTLAIPMDEKEQKERKPVYKEKFVSPQDPPRVGVFICQCGTNIGGFINVPELVKAFKNYPSVEYVMDNLYTCSADSQDIIKEKIEEYNLNRVIVAACTPRTHEPLFQDTLQEAGLNPYLLSFVSIRELVSWVHMKEGDKADQKALDLIKMGISRVLFQESLYETTKECDQSAIVIGGGIAGITAALEIADHNFPVHIIEKDEEIGGQLRNIHKFNFDQLDATEELATLRKKIESNPLIKVSTSSLVKNMSGSIGSFTLSFTDASSELQEISGGTIIVATGAEEYKPHDLFDYGKDSRIQTNLELSNDLKDGNIKDGETIVFIQCVGSRQNEGRTYCSLICCSQTVRHALFIKEQYPNSNIFVMYRDIRVSFDEEIYYWKAKEFINYIRYTEYPSTEIKDDGIYVSVKDILTQANLQIKADRLVLATPLVSHKENKSISELLKVPIDAHGFFLEAHVKLRPVDFATEGIYLCGTAHGPKGFADSIAQARAAASRALIPLTNGIVTSEPIVVEITPENCIGCNKCYEVCPFGAIGIDLIAGKTTSEVNQMLCKGCGTCVSLCPGQAIKLNHFTSKQIEVMISESMKVKNISPKIVAFLCNWCSYAGADTAGVSRFQYPTNARIIRVMCSGRIDPNFVLQAFIEGADAVFIGGCHLGDCHYLEGNFNAEKMFKKLAKLTDQVGVDRKRLRLEWISASEGKRFAEVMQKFIAEITELGPLFPISPIGSGDVKTKNTKVVQSGRLVHS
jgi:heterodisulfide reductase subunit A